MQEEIEIKKLASHRHTDIQREKQSVHIYQLQASPWHTYSVNKMHFKMEYIYIC